MDAHDRVAAEDPGGVIAWGEDFEAAAVLAFEVAEGAGTREVVWVVGAAVGEAGTEPVVADARMTLSKDGK